MTAPRSGSADATPAQTVSGNVRPPTVAANLVKDSLTIFLRPSTDAADARRRRRQLSASMPSNERSLLRQKPQHGRPRAVAESGAGCCETRPRQKPRRRYAAAPWRALIGGASLPRSTYARPEKIPKNREIAPCAEPVCRRPAVRPGVLQRPVVSRGIQLGCSSSVRAWSIWS
jgi:hypothetical protein